MLYGIVGALFSYCVSLAVASPLAAFAASAGYQVIMFIVSPLDTPPARVAHCCSFVSQLYLAAFLLTLTYAKTSADDYDLKLIRKPSYMTCIPSSLTCSDFTMAIASPVANAVRTAVHHTQTSY